MAVRSVSEFARRSRAKLLPLVIAPYMGEVGQRLCDEAGIGWLDLSGNAHLLGPGLHVRIEGKPNQFKRVGRPRSVFAPRSSRIARCLLIEPRRAFSQRELAKVAGVDEGFTSRIVRHLEEQELVVRENNGAVRVVDAEALLTALARGLRFRQAPHRARSHRGPIQR